jgi:peptidoglycan/LPS O-acetylase OafA/YrhL
MVAIFRLNVSSAIYHLSFVKCSYLFVDCFFVLSGFVIAHSYSTFENALKTALTA